MKNTEVREYARNNGVRLWQIAERMGLCDGNFSRKLRKEFSAEEKALVIAIIDDLAKGGNYDE